MSIRIDLEAYTAEEFANRGIRNNEVLALSGHYRFDVNLEFVFTSEMAEWLERHNITCSFLVIETIDTRWYSRSRGFFVFDSDASALMYRITFSGG